MSPLRRPLQLSRVPRSERPRRVPRFHSRTYAPAFPPLAGIHHVRLYPTGPSMISPFASAYRLPFSSISICSFLSVRRRTKTGTKAVTVAVRNSAAASAESEQPAQ
jgi:hypothetical protein